jgi:hypothetical protein
MIRSFAVLAVCAVCFGAGVLWAEHGQTGASATGTRREPQFENDHVRVWKSIIMPNQPLALHRHERGRALIALKGGQIKIVDKDGKTVKTNTWESGKAYWLDADPPGQLHGDLNDTAAPIEVIVVEMKK